MSDTIRIRKGSGNVFADIGLPDAEHHQLKASLVALVQRAIDDRALTQARAAGIMGAKQPDVSRILNGHFRNVSVERLMKYLNRLGCDVEITVKPKNKPAFQKIRLDAVAA